MGFLDQMAKAAALGMAVEMSKNKKGKPDPYKAAGIPQFCSSIQPLIAWKSFVLRLPSIFSFEI